MKRGSSCIVQQVFQRLQTDQLDDSCDENKETELQNEEFTPNCNAGIESSFSDTDSGKDEQSFGAVSIDFPSGSDQSASQNTAGQVKARNKTVWKNTTGVPGVGRALFSEAHYQPRKKIMKILIYNLNELESFVCIQVARRVLVGKKMPLKQLWN